MRASFQANFTQMKFCFAICTTSERKKYINKLKD